MNEAAVVLDAAGVIVYANPHFAQLVGAAPGSVPERR
jgi:PAS domain-containing protein